MVGYFFSDMCSWHVGVVCPPSPNSFSSFSAACFASLCCQRHGHVHPPMAIVLGPFLLWARRMDSWEGGRRGPIEDTWLADAHLSAPVPHAFCACLFWRRGYASRWFSTRPRGGSHDIQ